MSSDSNPKYPNSVDLDAARANLAQSEGKRLWQSLDELSETQEYHKFLEHEFPNDTAKEPEAAGINRRDALKLMAASAAMAGLSACTKMPLEKIVPYVKPPEEIIPGKALFYATSMSLGGVATGVLVESHMGRPTKIEGNPEHPGSLGGTSAQTQASILNLYDPDRSQTVLFLGRIDTWSGFVAAIANIRTQLGTKGEGLRVLTETVTSPTLGAQMKNLLTQYPEAKWHQYEPCGRDNERDGARMAFGKPVNAVYHFDKADVVVSLDSDFLNSGPGHVRYARDFAGRRGLEGPQPTLNRLYVAESMPTGTGAVADHRRPIRATEVETLAQQLAAAVGAGGGKAANSNVPADWTSAVARDLTSHRGSSIVIAGEGQPAEVHALAHAMNSALGNFGKTVTFTDALEADPVNQTDSLRELVGELNAGKVGILLIIGANPVYNAPADLDFKTAITKAELRIHSGLYTDETAQYCHWHVPATHYLESWSDARGYDGTIGIVQPLIAPLYDSHSVHEIIAALSGVQDKSDHDILRDYWKSQRPEKDKAFEDFWEVTLHDGVMAGTALPGISVSAKADFASQSASRQTADPNALEIVFRPDPSVGDGRFANNGWLQEVPKPITRLAWDNAAMVSPKTAQKLGVSRGDYVKIELSGRETKAGTWIVPGHADDSITLHLGYGRWLAGKIGSGPGFNAYPLRTTAAPWQATGVRISKTGNDYSFASVQHQYPIDRDHQETEQESTEAFRRDLVRIATLDEFRKNPDFAKSPEEEATAGLSLYPGFKYNGYAWGMAIDLNKCVGCNACVVACQSENNIAVVGKDQVERGRSMHWIRIDTYFRGDLETPEMYFEPLPCMQCENAPCEYVCPVGATTHSPEGLNEMTYNRCVGTRYCSNNCPYKVRRFNFYLFSDWTTKSLYGLRNPNVTVRSRGVMEKCTYCVQRINAAKIRSEEENRSVHDGEIVTACQGACPANAIVFGNINDPNSRVAKLKAQSRDYRLLTELNTRPRTSYLARVQNPNPEIRES